MGTPQLFVPALLVTLAFSGCSRPDVEARTARTTQQAKIAAARASEQLADSWLTTKIQAQYLADDDISARRINVSTRDRVVTLTGHVDDAAERDLAVQIALITDGVRQVTDRLTVRTPAGETGAAATTGTSSPPMDAVALASGADALVTTRVRATFFLDDRLKGRYIAVETRSGVVTLSGQVADEEERAQALLLARGTDGVTRVEDLLTIVPPPAPASLTSDSDAAVTTTIQAKYYADPLVRPSAIDVTSHGGVVTLQGAVESDAVRQQALAIARSAAGVTQVVDRLTVTQAVDRRR